MLKRYFVLAAICALVFAFGRTTPSKPASSQALNVLALSSRPDMVTGGSVLIQITASGGAPSQKVAVTLNGQDVTKAFRPDLAGKSLIGRVEGLAMGSNTLEVSTGSKDPVRLMLTNHSISGPLFSGPHQKPFVCQTEGAGLGPALDEDCNAKTVVAYFYKSTQPPVPGARGGRGGGQVDGPAPAPPGFKPFDPSAARPADLAQITLPDGKTVDYIVRRETGTINRAIYQFAFLHQPGQPLPDPWTVTPGWNGRLIYEFGGGCRAGYHQAAVPSALDDKFLSQGYAVAGSSLNVFGNNCDDVISAETLMMVKEHFTKQFGKPVHTMGTGGSGGAIQQYMIAQNYPGLLDSIMPERGSPDQVTMLPGQSDCALLSHAFETSKQSWSDEQKTAVSGFATWNTCSKGWMPNYVPGFIQATDANGSNCDASIPKALIYDPVGNRAGARCDVYDNQANEYGRDPSTGFARRPLDNVGVQYGLNAFNSGKISADQFIELNERIGGLDADGNIVAARTVTDPAALRAAYLDGRLNYGAGGMSTTPIIDYRPYVDTVGNIHDRFRSSVARARLIAANGNADNQVILTFPPAATGNAMTIEPARIVEMMRLMDQWLDNIAKDTSHDSAAAKVARNKPAELVDACWTPQGEKISEPQAYDGHGRCNELYPSHGEPRIAAGGPLADDILKCSLKPVDSKDYKNPMTPDQITRLKTIFPQGVCDYSRPGVEQQKLAGAWRKY